MLLSISFVHIAAEVATENSIQLKMSAGTLVAGKITVLGLNQS